MKRWFCLAMALLFFMAAPLFAGEYTVQKKAGDYTVDIRMDKNPPVVGCEPDRDRRQGQGRQGRERTPRCR